MATLISASVLQRQGLGLGRLGKQWDSTGKVIFNGVNLDDGNIHEATSTGSSITHVRRYLIFKTSEHPQVGTSLLSSTIECLNVTRTSSSSFDLRYNVNEMTFSNRYASSAIYPFIAALAGVRFHAINQ